MIDFKGHRFEQDMILTGVRWYLAYPLRYRNREEMLAERGVEVDHSSVYRWVQKFTPQLEAARLAVCWGGAGLEPGQTINGHCDRYRQSDGRCGSWPDDGSADPGCGCFLTKKAKLHAAKCPLDRWPEPAQKTSRRSSRREANRAPER